MAWRFDGDAKLMGTSECYSSLRYCDVSWQPRICICHWYLDIRSGERFNSIERYVSLSTCGWVSQTEGRWMGMIVLRRRRDKLRFKADVQLVRHRKGIPVPSSPVAWPSVTSGSQNKRLYTWFMAPGILFRKTELCVQSWINIRDVDLGIRGLFHRPLSIGARTSRQASTIFCRRHYLGQSTGDGQIKSIPLSLRRKPRIAWDIATVRCPTHTRRTQKAKGDEENIQVSHSFGYWRTVDIFENMGLGCPDNVTISHKVLSVFGVENLGDLTATSSGWTLACNTESQKGVRIGPLKI